MERTILLVDDDPVNRDVVQRRLEREGYVVDTADSGALALELLSVQRFDLIILDVLMPEMDGTEVLRRIKADPRFNKTPVMMLSSSDDRSLVIQCLELGASDYLHKPLNMALAKTRIERCFIRRPAHVARDAKAVHKGSRILIVDDDEVNRDLLVQRVGRIGHVPTAVGSGEEALAALENDGFDLVLLDIIMPEMNGIEVLKAIKSDPRFRGIFVIMVSAEDSAKIMLECLELGADDYITKPFDAVFLRTRINSCLDFKKFGVVGGLG